MNQNGEQQFHPVVDVGTQRVARVYAEALINSAEKRGQADALLEELGSLFDDVFRSDPEFEAFFGSAAVGRKPKADVLRKVFEGRASELFFNFLMVLNEHERLDLLRPIRMAYKELHDQRSGRLRVWVRTAVPLPDDQRQRLEQELRETFHKEPLLEGQVDPELLGGLVVQVGDWLYDASVRTQLKTIRNQIIERSSYEIQSRRDRFSTPIGD